jgi:cysteine desulfurase/selenocysteine lyase
VAFGENDQVLEKGSRPVGRVVAATPVGFALSTAIEDHCRRLSLQISNGLRELGLPVYGPGRQEHRSHIVSVGPLLTDEHDTVSDPSIADFSSYLARNRVGHSIRRGLLRLSVHAYNDDSDVDALLELARRWNAGPRAREK